MRPASRRARCRTRSTIGPGCRTTTRERILRIADELGWRPNSAARSLSASRANACGLVLARPARTLAVEALLPRVPRGRRVRALRALDRAHPPARDRRRERGRGVPALVGGAPGRRRAPARPPRGRPAHRGARRARTPGRGRRRTARRSLTPLRLARRAGSRRRAGALPRGSRAHADRARRRRRRLRAQRDAHGRPSRRRRASSGSPPASSRPTTRRRAAPARPASSCSDPEPPTAIAYDSDVLAVAGARGRAADGRSRSRTTSRIVAWDDSLLCQVVHPPLTTLTRDIAEFGALACNAQLLAADRRPRRSATSRRRAAC